MSRFAHGPQSCPRLYSGCPATTNSSTCRPRSDAIADRTAVPTAAAMAAAAAA